MIEYEEFEVVVRVKAPVGADPRALVFCAMDSKLGPDLETGSLDLYRKFPTIYGADGKLIDGVKIDFSSTCYKPRKFDLVHYEWAVKKGEW